MLVYDKTKCFGGNPKLEAMLKRRMLEHRKADDFIRGVYYTLASHSILNAHESEKKWRGCAVGCAVHEVGEAEVRYPEGDDRAYLTYHERFVEMFLLPRVFASLIDELFENVVMERAPDFASTVVQGLSHKADRRVLAGLCLAYQDRLYEVDDINDIADEFVKAVAGLSKTSRQNIQYYV